MAIAANELRIGNWVTGSSNDIYQRPFEVTARDFTLPDFTENVRPIPLTPDILIACGFEKHNADAIFSTENYTKWEDGLSCVRLIGGYFDYFLLQGRPTTRVYYLHQLQNLYYSLTGKEIIYENK